MSSPANEEGPVSTQALIQITAQKKQIQYKLVEEKSTQQVGLFVVPCSLCPEKNAINIALYAVNRKRS